MARVNIEPRHETTAQGHESQSVSDVEQFGELAHERHEVMKKQLEQAERRHRKNRSELVDLEEAKSLAEQADGQKNRHHEGIPAERRKSHINKRIRSEKFNEQMKQIQSDMSATERITSRFIHNNFVEKTSDIAASTFARPNALLSGSIFAFIGITAAYFTAKHFGFQLSGFETLAAFIIGWLAGIIYDYTRALIKGRRD